MAKGKRKTGDTGQAIREAVGGIFSCGSFFPRTFETTGGIGTQLSLTGAPASYGNDGTFDDVLLADTLAGYPSLRRTGRPVIKQYAVRRRFTVLCGNTDRCVALAGCIRELIACGITKILITADTNEERDNLAEALSLMRAELSGILTLCYGINDNAHTLDSRALAEDIVSRFLTTESPAVMLIAQPSFTRECNLIRRGGEYSLASRLADAAPVVLTSSETVDSARSMAVSAGIFSPLATVCFAGEVRTLRDAVIFRPEEAGEIALRAGAKTDDDLMQLGFRKHI